MGILRRIFGNNGGSSSGTTTTTSTTTPPKTVSDAINKLSGINIPITPKPNGGGEQSVGGGANLGTDNSVYVNLDDINSNNPNPPMYNRGGGNSGSGNRDFVNINTGNTLSQDIRENARQQQINQGSLRNVNVNRNGGVSVGQGRDRRTYTGNAYIPELDTTANRYQEDWRKRYNEGKDKKDKVGYGQLSVKTQTGTEDFEGEKIVYDKFGDVKEIKSKALNRNFNSYDEYSQAVNNKGDNIIFSTPSNNSIVSSNFQDTSNPFASSLIKNSVESYDNARFKGQGEYNDKGEYLYSGGVLSAEPSNKETALFFEGTGYALGSVNPLLGSVLLGFGKVYDKKALKTEYGKSDISAKDTLISFGKGAGEGLIYGAGTSLLFRGATKGLIYGAEKLGGKQAVNLAEQLSQKGGNLLLTQFGGNLINRGYTTGQQLYFGDYGGASVSGSKIAGELLGFGAVNYGSRRLNRYSEVKKYASQLPADKQEEFWKTYKEAKSLRGITPDVKELDLSRLSLIEKNPKAQEYLKGFFSSDNKLIIGGSISQQPQFEKGISGTKRPGDIDIYVRRIFGTSNQEASYGERTAKKIADELNILGLKAESNKNKVLIGGEKFIETHSYKDYLKGNVEQVTPIWYPAQKSITRTADNVNILRLDIQAPRKVIGFYLEPVISGKERLKDLPAYETIKESLLKTKGKQDEGFLLNKEIKELKGQESNKELFNLNVKEPTSKRTQGFKKTSETSQYNPYRDLDNMIYSPSNNKKDGGYNKTNRANNFIYPIANKINDIPYNPNLRNKITFINKQKTPNPTIYKRNPKTPDINIINPKKSNTNYNGGGSGNPITELRRIINSVKKGEDLSFGSFDVGIIEKGKKKIIGKGLSLSDARDTGTKRILQDLRATFYLTKSKEKLRDITTGNEFKRYEKLLRKPLANSRYNKLGDEVYVQKKEKVGNLGGRLSFFGEKREIKNSNKNPFGLKSKKKNSIWI